MKNIRSNSGQAIVEYMLVLIVVVGLILGGLYQLNSAFKVWANAYFGEYLMCLMEAGEVPGLGAPNPDSECKELYREFSLSSGDTVVGGGVDENGNAVGGGGDGSNSGSATGAPSGNSENSFVSRSRADGNRRGTASRFRRRGPPGGEDDEGGISREGSSGGGNVTDGFSNEDGSPRRFAVRGSAGRKSGRRLKEEKEKAEKKTKAKNVEQGPEQRSGPKLIKISRAPSNQGEAPKIEEMGFGGFLRYLIIAAIIIAVVIFLGGQVLQVSKSME